MITTHRLSVRLFVTWNVALNALIGYNSKFWFKYAICMPKGKKKSYKCTEYAERLCFSAFPLLQLHSHSLALALFHTASVEEVHRYGSEDEALTT